MALKLLRDKKWNLRGKGGYGVCAGWREMIDGVH